MLADQGKYDWDGAKTQFEPDQLLEFYEKLVAEHPLLTYIEDPFVLEHIAQYKKMQEKLAEAAPAVQIGLSSKVFDEDIERIKDMVTFINPEEEDEEESKNQSMLDDGS